MRVDEYDEAIRTEVLAALKVNPAAGFLTVLGNWQHHRHWCLAASESARARTILEEERAVLSQRRQPIHVGLSESPGIAAAFIDDRAKESRPRPPRKRDRQLQDSR